MSATAEESGVAAPRGVNLRCEYLSSPLGIDRPRPRLSWEMRDERRGAVQAAYQVLVADQPERLAADHGNLWDSGKVISDQSVQVTYAGVPLRARQPVWWKVRLWDRDDRPGPWSDVAHWSMGLLEPDDWDAQWIGLSTEHNARAAATQPAPGPPPLPAPMLRREFTVSEGTTGVSGAPAGVRRATAYISALGLYEMRINGRRVSDRILAPEWTDYNRRVQYQTYDVTDLLRPGPNAIGVLLGDGWYAGRIGLTQIVEKGPARAIYGREPALKMRLDIESADGRTQTIVTDGTWRATGEGPVRVGDLLDGETYDARREIPGWDAPGYDDAAWSRATIAFGRDPQLVAQPNEPIRVFAELKSIALTAPRPGVYVYDLGQNMVGWCRLALNAPTASEGLVPGAEVTLRHAEVLNPDGTIYTANLRSAQQTDRYTCRGDTAGEVFEPHFTYHGFRYVEVTGLPYKPALEDLVGRAFCSSAPVAGSFECSEPLLNKLFSNIVWTHRDNLISVPTDCPQRDERLGWMGDILAFAQTACFDLDMAAFYTKWLPDVRDAQTADGRYPDFAPHPFDPAARFSSVPAWGDAGVFVPWVAYVNYADKRLLEEHFDSARRWVDYVHAKNPDLLWKNSRGNDYGDWLNADTLKLEGWPKGAEVPKEVFATMFFARSAELVAKMAGVLGKGDEAAKYARLAADITAAFNKAYVAADGRIQGDTQAGYALALHFNLLPDELRPAAAKYMLEGFEKFKGNISTGFHSTICLMQELSGRGYNDHAYRLVLNRTMPSWGYLIDHGATTIWERWDGWVDGRGFQDPGMNSFAHYAFGSVGEWLFRTVLGINPDESKPGYKHMIIRPRPGPGLMWAKGTYHSIHGPIASAWKIEDAPGGSQRLTMEIEIPANATSTVYVPLVSGGAAADVMEGGRPAAQAPGVEPLGVQDGAAVFRVGGGKYVFTAPAGS